MKPRTRSPHHPPARLPEDYANLCRKVWLPRHFALPADYFLEP